MNLEKSCGAVVFSKNKVLIIEHNFGHISFPKGHVEGNETEEETAIREVREETGIDIEIVNNKRYSLRYSPKNNVSKEVIYFVAKKIGGELKPQFEEIASCYFVDKDKAIDLITFDNDREMYLDILKDIKKGEF